MEQVCCGACGRALAACEWCGSADVLTGPGGQRWPVARRHHRPGAFHDPCWAQEQALLAAASRFRGEDPQPGRYCCLNPMCDHPRDQVFNGGADAT